VHDSRDDLPSLTGERAAVTADGSDFRTGSVFATPRLAQLAPGLAAVGLRRFGDGRSADR